MGLFFIQSSSNIIQIILHLLHRFKRNSGFGYDEMLLFDDEYRNIVDITRIGKYLTKNRPPYEPISSE